MLLDDDGAVIDPSATETAVLALIPAAEPAVGKHRRALDPTTAAGVPAHVTVLYPFVPPAEVTTTTVATLRAAVSPVAPFACRFTGTGWFGEDLLWLAPTPADPFAELTRRVWRSFPEQVPYGGEHEPHPHLTVGYGSHASLEALRAAEAELRPSLPVEAAVDRLHLLAGARAPDSWRVVAELPLAGIA
ncbi:2'-5' RNA ligase family protein [Actinomycetospora endophytica]|uniref:2'-5' RNA ligase family protein n=1 Tax=Actinomycetospora endophytica TaxID=2291215 RepID=A0ABS8P376_9PSEU|nr:2'-5' RNA ligase family protein [Actinomycetospora endophytica]MCD2192702.1 2'-5' RNA ligase family protein [Actinomycetospora endophytica]